jgi:beta-galactosidase
MRADISWLTNPAIFQVNRLDAHSDHVCYASAEEAARGQTTLRQSLDGMEQVPDGPPRRLLAGGF